MNKELKDLRAGLEPYGERPAWADADSVQKLIDYIALLEDRIKELEDKVKRLW